MLMSSLRSLEKYCFLGGQFLSEDHSGTLPPFRRCRAAHQSFAQQSHTVHVTWLTVRVLEIKHENGIPIPLRL